MEEFQTLCGSSLFYPFALEVCCNIHNFHNPRGFSITSVFRARGWSSDSGIDSGIGHAARLCGKEACWWVELLQERWTSWWTIWSKLGNIVRQLYEFVEWRALIPYCSSVSRLSVRLVIWLNTSHMIIPSHPLHPSPGCTWTWSIVFRLGSLIRSSHPILFIGHQQVRELGQQIIHLIIPSHLLHPSPVRTWTWSIVLRSLIRSFHSIFSIRRQKVRESGQLF